MNVVVTGYLQTPQQKKVPATSIAQNCRGHKGGCFHYESAFRADSKTVTITFTTVVYLDLALRGSAVQDVLNHENRHYSDFKDLAAKLQSDMQRSLQARKETAQDELQVWMDWFDYDNQLAFNNFHRSIGAKVDIVFPPNSPRPR